MDNARLKDLLKQKSLRVTSARTDILRIFLDKGHKAISHADLEDELIDFDRVTIYRTLKQFVESGLLHQVDDGTGKMKYALCDECSHVRHEDDHLHFRCEKCDETVCLDHIAIPEIPELKGYKIETKQYTLSGTCDKCNTK